MSIKLCCLYLVQHMLHQIKALQFYTVSNPPLNGKIQGLFKAFEFFSSTFLGKFNFQGLFETNLYIQVHFKPVQTLGMLGDFTCFFSCLCFFLKSTFAKKILGIPSVLSSLDLDEVQHSLGPDQGPDCLQRLSADGTS